MPTSGEAGAGAGWWEVVLRMLMEQDGVTHYGTMAVPSRGAGHPSVV